MKTESAAKSRNGSPGEQDSELAHALETYLAELEAGGRPNPAKLIAQHPAVADRLRACLGSLQFVNQAAGEVSSDGGPAEAGLASPAGGTLGDFRIIRQVGRGGMGVVYEAEQISLARRVALKVLPFAGMLDPRQLQRFKNEAQAAAQLDHPNIVGVIAVGCERGVHYYAMRFIDGPTLADVVAELASGGRQPPGSAASPLGAVSKSSGFGVQGAGRGEGSQDEQSAERGRRSAEQGRNQESGAGSQEEDGRSASSPRSALRVPRLDDPTTAFTPEPEIPSSPPLLFPASPPTSDPQSEIRDPQFQTSPIAALSTDRAGRGREYFRSVAMLAIQAAEALDHAHELGVIHRDIKPSNLILDMQGKPWITDFGLARIESQAEMTRTGDLLGTLRYMSPEQALGKRVPVDHRTDIYSLGVTLYELLTLRPAFDGEERQEVLRQVSFEDPRPPRRVDPRVPIELETIVLKAVEKNPADRFATAGDLADDLRRFLDERPIRARRPGLRDQAVKWARRHRAWAQAAAAALVLVTIVSLAALVLVNAARRNTQTALVAETRAKDEARQAIDRYVEAVQEDEVLKDERFQPLRRKLLGGALRYYQEFIRDHEHDAAARHNLAKALEQVGRISHESGSADAALAAYARAVELRQSLATENPGIAEYQSDLATSYNNLGHLQHETGDSSTALASYGKAIEIQDKVAHENPAVTEYRGVLASSHHRLGHLQGLTGDTNTAQASYGKAIEIRDELARTSPTIALHQHDLAASYDNLGILQSQTGDGIAAIANCLQAFKIRDNLAHENPAVTEYQSHLASSYAHIGHVESLRGNLDAALTNGRHALEIDEKLVRENPVVTKYQSDLSIDYHNAGLWQQKKGDLDAALTSYLNAMEIQKKVVRDHPTVTQYQHDLAIEYNSLGALQKDKGDLDAAQTSYRQALDIHDELVREHPSFTAYRVVLGGSCCNLGLVEHDRGNTEAALFWFDRAAATLEGALARDPRHALASLFLRNTHSSRAVTLWRLSRHAEAEKEWQLAVELSIKLDDAGGAANVRLGRVEALAESGDHARAATEARELAAMPQLPGEALYNLACVLAPSSAAAKYDANLASGYAAEAVELLKRARQAGFFANVATVAHMSKDPDLEPLRARDDFRKLLEELGNGAPPANERGEPATSEAPAAAAETAPVGKEDE